LGAEAPIADSIHLYFHDFYITDNSDTAVHIGRGIYKFSFDIQKGKATLSGLDFLKVTPGVSPVIPSEGMIYANLIKHKLLYYNGASWDTISGQVASGGGGGGEEGGESGTNVLSHDQYMVTYEGASNNDIVGTFDPWYPTDDTSSASFSYVLLDSKGGTYAINSSTGIVTILSNTALTAGTDTLTVRTTLSGNTEDHYAFVTVKATSDCYFMNPGVGGSHDGTRANPYASWSGVTFAEDKAYFQLRGTTYTTSTSINVSGTSGHEVIYGAYGTGARPIITTGAGVNGMAITASYVKIFEYKFLDCLTTGIRIRGQGYSNYTNLTFSDLELENSDQGGNGQIYFMWIGTIGQYQHADYLSDIVCHDGTEFGIKNEIGGLTMENIRTYNHPYSGISNATEANHYKITGLSSYDNLHYAVEMSGYQAELAYSVLKCNNGYCPIEQSDSTSARQWIHHNVIDGNGGYSYGLINMITGATNPGPLKRNFLIENNEFKNSVFTVGATGVGAIEIRYNTDSVVIRRNKFHNLNYGIQINSTITPTYGYQIYYNIFYDNDTCILGTASSNIGIYNNLIDGSAVLPGTTGETVRNNFYTILTSAGTSSNNIDLDAITKTNYFLNYTGHDYHLKATAALAIDLGYNLSLTPDYDGVTVGNPPEIGTFEYIP
jgi:hypothetical protein